MSGLSQSLRRLHGRAESGLIAARKAKRAVGISLKAFLSFFGRPEMVAVAWLIGVFGAIWGVYTYYATQEKPGLTYFEHPSKAAVVRTGQTSRLAVLFDGKEVTGNVTASQVAIWNAGRKPIRSDSVLKPLVISTADGSRILEARLQKVSREVAGFKMDISHLAQGKVALSWSILEEGDGAVVQIVYAAGDDVQITADAVLVGQPEILKETFTRSARSAGEQYSRGPQSLRWAIGLGALFLLLGSAGIVFVKKRAGRLHWLDLVFLLGMPMLSFIMVLYTFFRPLPGPPFGF